MELEPQQDGQSDFKPIPNGLDDLVVVRNLLRLGIQERSIKASKSGQMDGADLKNLPMG